MVGTIGIILGAVGTALAIANQIQRWVEKRRLGRTDEHRLDIEGLRALAAELRIELTDARKTVADARADLAAERDARTVDRARIVELEQKVAHLEQELRDEREARTG